MQLILFHFSPNPAKFKEDNEAEVIARTLRAESHIIGWFYLTLGMLSAVTFMFCMRCRSNFSYEQHNYITRYNNFIRKIYAACCSKRDY